MILHLYQCGRTQSHLLIARALHIKEAGIFHYGSDNSTRYTLEISAYSELCTG